MVLFPILAGLLIPYLLTGLLGASGVVAALTRGAFPEAFPATMGGVPGWLTGLAISGVVMVYVFSGGLRATAWANAFQTMVFLTTAVAAFFVIANRLGGPEAISHRVLAFRPDLLVREGNVTHLQFFTYLFIPVSAAMFPHLFQHWLTARSARAFRTTVVLHPIAMAVLWLPCTLIGMWAAVALLPNGTAVVAPNSPPNTELAQMVEKLTAPLLGGLLGSGILAAIMSSLDSQFLALGTMFTEDVAHHYFGRDKLSDSQRVKLGRLFVVLMIALTYALSLWAPRSVFALGIWCFNGYAALAPLIIAAIYWKRATAAGAIGSVLVTGVAWLLLYRAAGYGQDANYLFLGMMPAAALFMVASAVLIGVSLITRPPSLGTLDLFFSADEPATVLTSGAYSAKL